MARKTTNSTHTPTVETAAPAAEAVAPMPVQNDEWVANFFLGTLLFVLVVLVYLPAFKAGFIWDDDQLLTVNRQVQSPDGWWTLWIKPETADYFPLTSWTLWLEWGFWHMAASGYHMTNVLLHATATVLTWQALKRLRIPGAWVAAMIFGVHPVCVESVAWISERKNTISQIFFLLSIIQYLRFEEKGREWRYLAAILCFTLSLLAKTSVVMLPFVLILLTWWRRPEMEKDITAWKSLALRMVPFFLVATLLGAVTVYFQYGRAIGGEEIPLGNLFQRAASACFAAGFYLYSAFWPFNLVEIYPQWHRAFPEYVPLPTPHWQPPAPESLPYWLQTLPGVVIAGLLAWCWVRREKSWARAILVALGCYLIAMLPALGMLKMSYMRLTLVADHFQYISIAAIIALVVAAGTTRALKPLWLVAASLFFAVVTWFNWKQTPDNHFAEALWIGGPLVLAVGTMVRESWKALWLSFLTAVIICFCIISCEQSAIYHSEGTLWSATLEKNPDSWQAHNHLGAYLYTHGDWKAAQPHFLRATQLKPENPESHNNLGLTYMMQGRMDDAIREYGIALGIKDDASMRTNRANAYLNTKQFDKAIDDYTQAIIVDPRNPTPQCYLGMALMTTGKMDEAIPHFMKAMELNPNMAEATDGLVEALKAEGVNLAAPDFGKSYRFDLAHAMSLLEHSPVLQQRMQQQQQAQQQQQQ